MRFLSSPWVGMLESGPWLRNASHANACARLFADRVANISGVRLVYPVEANAVFVSIADAALEFLRKRGWDFYTFIGGSARFMFSWDSSIDRIDELCRDPNSCVEESLAGRDSKR
jgi:threonine aldolase